MTAPATATAVDVLPATRPAPRLPLSARPYWATTPDPNGEPNWDGPAFHPAGPHVVGLLTGWDQNRGAVGWLDPSPLSPLELTAKQWRQLSRDAASIADLLDEAVR